MIPALGKIYAFTMRNALNVIFRQLPSQKRKSGTRQEWVT